MLGVLFFLAHFVFCSSFKDRVPHIFSFPTGEHIMAQTNLTPASRGYFEKNFSKLKHYQHLWYMWARIIMFWLVATSFTGFYVWDALYLHSPDGVPMKYVYVAGLVILLTVLRKTVIRLIQLKEQTSHITIDEDPYDPWEPWWMHLGFRATIVRRGLIGTMTLATEAFAGALMFFSWVAVGINHGFFDFSAHFPFVLRPIDAKDIMLPENTWMAVAIGGIALGLTWVNNSLFLLKYPAVREPLLHMLEDYLIGKSPARTVAREVLDLARRRGNEKKECCPEELAARIVLLLRASPPRKYTSEHEEKVRELVREIIALLANGKNEHEAP